MSKKPNASRAPSPEDADPPRASDPARPFRVAVVGTGHWAADVHIPGLISAGASVIAVCGRRDEPRRKVAERYDIPQQFADWQEMLDTSGADGVSVCTPNDLHTPISVAAARKGLHIACEKPLATNVPDARAAWDAARNVVTLVGFSHRFVPSAQLLKEMIEAGDLGEIYHVFAHMLQGWLVDANTPAGWRLNRAQAGGGTLGDLGSHLLDLVVWYAGDIARISGHLRTFVTERPAPDGGTAKVDVDDAASALAEFAAGATGVFTVSRYVCGTTSTFGTQGVTVAGSKGTVMYDPGRVNALLLAERGQAYRQVEVPERLRMPSEDLRAHLPSAMMSRFVGGAQAGTRVRPDFEDGLRCQILMDAWERSHRDGTWIEVPPMPEIGAR
ncbi:MAG: Gfo/Idh/MocA family oxidoreductase [Armatimonadota bacterium]|nr:MAG: Gfo/Idh/MocA family oxidoreductase [Armatimonadota bacterium]